MKYNTFTAKSIATLAKTIISGMPDSYFTKECDADRYMLTGDDKFTQRNGEKFTCGFASSVLTPDDVTKEKYYIAGYGSDNTARACVVVNVKGTCIHIVKHTLSGIV